MNTDVCHYIIVSSKETDELVGYAEFRFRLDWLNKIEPVLYLYYPYLH